MYCNRLQSALQNLYQCVVWFFHLRSSCTTHISEYICIRFRWTKITHKASDVAENLQLYQVVQFFHPRLSCMTTHILLDVQRIMLNASCMTISGRRTKQLYIFCHVTGFKEWFSQFHSCGTYSVLSRSPSVVTNSCIIFAGRKSRMVAFWYQLNQVVLENGH